MVKPRRKARLHLVRQGLQIFFRAPGKRRRLDVQHRLLAMRRLGKAQPELEPRGFRECFNPVFNFRHEGERLRGGHHPVGKARQEAGARRLIRPRHTHRAGDAADVGLSNAGFRERRMNAELFQSLLPRTVDREVGGVRAVAELAARGMLQELREDVRLADVAAVFPRGRELRDAQGVGGDERGLKPHGEGVLHGAFAFRGRHVGPGDVQKLHAVAEL